MRRALLLALALVASACGGGPEAQPGEVIGFTTEDGVRLVGELRGAGPRGVVLGHMFGSSREAWGEFATIAAEEGFLTLAFDFRGFGDSEGERDAAAAPRDLRAAVAALREQGAERVAVVGASFAGTGALVAAGEEDWSAVATLSAPRQFEGLSANEATVEAVDEPKLFLAAQGDGTAADAALAFYEAASGAKRVEIVVGDEHGTELLDGPRGEIVRNLLLAFLDGQS